MKNFGIINYHFTPKHSVTSRKSNFIAWVANQLIDLKRNDAASRFGTRSSSLLRLGQTVRSAFTLSYNDDRYATR
jgi:hypothetical protein